MSNLPINSSYSLPLGFCHCCQGSEASLGSLQGSELTQKGDIETGDAEAEKRYLEGASQDGLRQVIEKAKSHLGKYALDLKVHDTVLEIIALTSKIVRQEEIEEVAAGLQRGIKCYEAGKVVYDGKDSYSLKTYFSGTNREAQAVAKSYLFLSTLAHTAVNLVSIASSYRNLPKDAIECLDSVLAPLFKNTIGAPMRIWVKYSNLQCALEMPETTEEEKKLKNVTLTKCRAEFALSISKAAVLLSKEAIPAVASPIISTALAVCGVAIALIDAYLIYTEKNPPKSESTNSEQVSHLQETWGPDLV